MEHFILNERPTESRSPESKRNKQPTTYKQKLSKLDTELAEIDEQHKTTKQKLIRELEVERNVYFEECSKLKVSVNQLKIELDNVTKNVVKSPVKKINDQQINYYEEIKQTIADQTITILKFKNEI